jgi:5'-nucleotidase
MRILIANDDGYLAPGMAALVQACRGWARSR